MAYRELLSWSSYDISVERKPCFGRNVQNINDFYCPLPVELPINFHVNAIQCGGDFCVALIETGHVYTWGSNKNGCLGYETRVETEDWALIPKKVEALRDVHIISVHCCNTSVAVVTSNGELYVWGIISISLTYPTMIKQSSPARVLIQDMGRVRSVSIAVTHLCVVDEQNTLFIVRLKRLQPVGIGETLVMRSKQPINDVDVVACDISSFAIVKTDGSFYTWGKENRYGKLGHGHARPVLNPTQVMINNVKSATLTLDNVAVITREGHVYTCGYNNEDCKLGYRSNGNQSRFRRIETLDNVRKVCFSNDFAIAVNEEEEKLYIWGKAVQPNGKFVDSKEIIQVEPVCVQNRVLDVGCTYNVICTLQAPPEIKVAIAPAPRAGGPWLNALLQ